MQNNIVTIFLIAKHDEVIVLMFWLFNAKLNWLTLLALLEQKDNSNLLTDEKLLLEQVGSMPIELKYTVVVIGNETLVHK